MKSRLFVVTGNGDEDINITSNGRVILFTTPHGNRNMHFLMMAKYWLTTKNATTFNFSFFFTFLLSPSRHMFPYQQYNVDEELLGCLEIIYDLIDFLDDIRLALETEKDLTPIIH